MDNKEKGELEETSEVKKNEIKDSTSPKIEVKTSSEETDYFVYLNRIVTSVLSSGIAIGLLIASAFGTQQIFGAGSLAEFDVRAVLVMTLLGGFCLFLSQSLQNYFVKIIEKESYKYVLGKTFKNFIWQSVCLIVFIPSVIYAMSVDGVAVFWSVVVYSFSSTLLSMSIREAEHNNRLQASIFGVFTASILWSVFVYTLYLSNSEIWQVAFLIILLIQSFVSEITVSMTDLIQKYFKD